MGAKRFSRYHSLHSKSIQMFSSTVPGCVNLFFQSRQLTGKTDPFLITCMRLLLMTPVGQEKKSGNQYEALNLSLIHIWQPKALKPYQQDVKFRLGIILSIYLHILITSVWNHVNFLHILFPCICGAIALGLEFCYGHIDWFPLVLW